jgi:hypothetical protein
MTEENTVESGSTAPETVILEEASDETLDSLLESADEELPGEDAAAVSTQPENVGEVSEATEEQEVSPKEPPKAPDVQEQLNQLKRQLDGMELLQKRRTSKLAELERHVTDEVARLEAVVTEKQFESPREAYEALNQINKNKEVLEAARAEHDEAQATLEGQKIVSAYVKPGEVTVDAMAECLVADGVDPSFVSEWAKAPLKFAHPGEIIHLAKRAKAESQLKTLVPVLKQLWAENQQLKANPDKVLNGIERAVKQTSFMPSGSGNSVSTKRQSGYRVEELSDKQLEELLENSR